MNCVSLKISQVLLYDVLFQNGDSSSLQQLSETSTQIHAMTTPLGFDFMIMDISQMVWDKARMTCASGELVTLKYEEDYVTVMEALHFKVEHSKSNIHYWHTLF